MQGVCTVLREYEGSKKLRAGAPLLQNSTARSCKKKLLPLMDRSSLTLERVWGNVGGVEHLARRLPHHDLCFCLCEDVFVWRLSCVSVFSPEEKLVGGDKKGVKPSGV